MPQTAATPTVDEEDPIRQARRALDEGRLDDSERQFASLLDSRWAADAHKGIGDVLLRRGSFPRAISAYRAALALRPDWPEAENNLGSAHKLEGNSELAEQHYRRALSLNPLLSHANNNLGVLLAEKGEIEEAVTRFRDAAESKPAAREARRNLATALLRLGRIEEARAEFERALTADPGDPDTLLGMARLRYATGQPREALELARGALHARPGFGEAYLMAGQAALALGDAEQAVPYCRHAVEAAPNAAAAHEVLGSALLDFGAPHDAEHHFRRALALEPDEPGALISLGRLFEQQGRTDEAERNYRAALQADPENALALSRLGNLALKARKPAEAMANFERALALQPTTAAAHNNLASALNDLGRHSEAANLCRQAIALNPNLAAAQHNLGAILQTLGQLDEARRCYERALELDPNLVPAIFSLTNLAPDAAREAALPTIETLLASDKLTDQAKAQLHFARVRLFERDGNHDAAFEAAVAGNAVQAGRQSYEPAVFERLVSGILETFTSGFFARRRSYGSPADQPIFIVGMPRSGSTLIEQVLASHPQVFGAGELPILPQLAGDLRRFGRTTRTFPHGVAELHEPEVLRLAGAYRRHTRALAGPNRRVTDKMTSNLLYLGLAALLFPRAKIVYCRRNPFDLFISGYFMLFRSAIPYTTDQRSFAHYYRLQEAVLAHWRGVLPIEIHEVRYEDFIADQEGRTRALLQYCELEWEPRCLDFYHTDRPIRTGSDIQVRQPLYRTSVGRALPYRKHLRELEAALHEIPFSTIGARGPRDQPAA